MERRAAASNLVAAPEHHWLNVPNTITAVRTIAAMTLAVQAIAIASIPLATCAFLTYWIGDIVDGWAARRLGQETRVGAVLDIVADRACLALCASALLVLLPETALPVAIFLIQFMVLDCVLSLSFLRWPLLLSPNYFGEVHRSVYRWNWSPPAKVLNSGGVVMLGIVTPSPLWPAALAVAVTVVKVISLLAVSRLAIDRVGR